MAVKNLCWYSLQTHVANFVEFQSVSLKSGSLRLETCNNYTCNHKDKWKGKRKLHANLVHLAECSCLYVTKFESMTQKHLASLLGDCLVHDLTVLQTIHRSISEQSGDAKMSFALNCRQLSWLAHMERVQREV